MMGHRGKLKTGDEWDAFTGWRKVLHWKRGELKRIKRRYAKRQRRAGKAVDSRRERKEVFDMATQSSLERAAQAWCQPSTEHIVMIPELAEAFAEILDAELDQLRVQLAGCSVAALGGVSPEQVANPGDYGWSASYQDVVDLRRRYETVVKLIKDEETQLFRD